MKRILAIAASAAAFLSLAAPPAVAGSPHMRLVSDAIVTSGHVRHSIETWSVGSHRLRTDTSEARVAGGGIAQTVILTRDAKAFARVTMVFTRDNGWRARPAITFADGHTSHLETIEYQPLRKLDVAVANARLNAQARAAAHPRMQLTVARSPRQVATIFDTLLACNDLCDAVAGGLGTGARLVCVLACLSS